MDITLEIFAVFVLVLFNGILSMSEIALVSSKPVRLKQRAESGDRGAGKALELQRSPGRFLSTVQVGITLVGVLSGAVGGAALGDEAAGLIARIPALAPYSQALGVGMVVLAITYLSLIVGELVPKQLGLRSPEAISAFMARPLNLLSRVSAPVVLLLDWSTRAVLFLLRIQPSEEPPVTEEEIRHLLEQGRQAGVFHAKEQEIVERVLRLDDMRLGDLVTHRSQMIALDIGAPLELSLARVVESGHSHFPVYQESLDRILGLVAVKDLLAKALAGEAPDLRACLTEPLYLPESLPALKVLESFRENGHHVALVLDEYGGIEGLVTLNDVLQAIVGEIPSAGDIEPMVVRREDGSWLLDGTLPVGELESLLRLTAAEAGDLDEYQTLGGFIMGRIGRVPTPGDHFPWKAWRFEVMDMDGLRVDKVLLEEAPTEEVAEPEGT
ncbi:MAG TPA: hemolysin family protein [Thermoanaerobaculia bacterium]|nr:hemolysin family protein [Thermoanaerobaculia bacterium]